MAHPANTTEIAQRNTLRDGIDGRIYTSPGLVELGAEFVHGKPPVLLDLLERGQVRTVTVEGEDRCYENGRLQGCEDIEEEAGGTLFEKPLAADMPFFGIPVFNRLNPVAHRACDRIHRGLNCSGCWTATMLCPPSFRVVSTSALAS